MRKLLACLCVLAVPFSAAAQDTPPALDPVVPQWAEIETVTAHAAPGPALWHVTRGDSEVWILGMIGNLPRGVTWNSAHLSEVMAGSRVMIMPPRPKIDILDIGWFLLGHCCSLFRLDRGKLDDVLPEPTRFRLASMRESVGGSAKDYQGDEPFGAAARLSRDFGKKYELDGDNPMTVVNRLAGKHDLKQEPAFRFDPMPIVREAIKLTPQAQRPCLDTAMEDMAREAIHARAMAEAWAVGDIAEVKAHFAEPRSQDCMVAAVHALGEMDRNRVPAFVAAISAALDRPGKSFAVVGLGPLLRKDGVLEQLRGRGFTIEGPPE